MPDRYAGQAQAGTRGGPGAPACPPPIRLVFKDMPGFLIVLLIVGLIAGAVARLLVPGRDPMGVLGTIALGVVGSFLGRPARLLTGGRRAARMRSRTGCAI
jgi:hypothetical protein